MKTLMIALTFLMTACVPAMKNTDLSESEMRLYNEWPYAYSVQDLKQNGVVIERPPGISQLVFRMSLPSEGGMTLKAHCVYYQVPYKQMPGKLSVEELKANSSCAETATGDSWLEVDNIKNLKVTLENFKLHFDFENSGKKISWSFLLPNLEGPLVHEKFEPVKEKKWRSGLSLLRTNADTFVNQNNKYLGKISDRMSRGTAIRCQQIDKNCNQVGEDRCDECRYGWYQVVDYNCPQGGSRFCGQNHCGEKGEPACPRGTKVVGGDDAGICQNDLTATMNADHILICQ